MRCIYEVCCSMLTIPGGVMKFLSVEGDVCTGSSTVDVFALGSELLGALWVVLERGGVGGLPVGDVVPLEGLSTR